jgi:nitrogen fixation-related uncharacterized protein
MRRRRASLSAWLGLLVVLAVTLPALGAATAWWAVDARQHADLDHRADQAAALIAQHKTLEPALTRGLAALNVEAELGTPSVKPVADATKDTAVSKDAKVAAFQRDEGANGTEPGVALTTGLQAILRSKPNAKDLLQARFVERTVPGANLFLPKPSRSARIAGAGVAALALLALVLATGYALLRRWLVQPLARMSADVGQVAGGHIAIAPVATRAREVADIGAALSGMGHGLRAALAERDAAEEQRRFLVTAIAHDLRTPLFTLRGSLEAIEHGIGADADHLRRAQDKAALLDSLVDGLFTYSRLEYAGPELTREPLDAVALAREAARAVDPRIVVAATAADIVIDVDRCRCCGCSSTCSTTPSATRTPASSSPSATMAAP